MSTKDLPVIDRGSFFDDPFFKDSWGDFDKAMQNVLDKFDNHGLKVETGSRTECQDAYRKIRSNKIDDDMYASQAFKVTEKDGKFQVVADVKDFNPRDLQVKVVDERIVLEGRYDKVSEDGKSSTSKAFYREFALPLEADIDQVSTALSKDGILTIKAPRREGAAISEDPQRKNASQYIQDTLNRQRFGNGPEYLEGMENLPKDVKDRLAFSDKDSGRSSASASPSSCRFSSPAPSEAGSEASRASTGMDFDAARKPQFHRPDVSFKTRLPTDNPVQGFPQNEAVSQSQNISKMPTHRPMTAPGSGGTATISVKEEDGKRTVTSETSSLVQEKDGFLETKEIAAEVKEKDSQAARREAITRMMKQDEDPEGKYRKSEAADASDVSETCVQTLPDGSVVTVKKSSTSTSNFKQSFTSGGPGLLDMGFQSRFGDFPDFRARGPSLMSQMSSDSLSSNMSNFSDMSNFSRFSDMPGFSNVSNFPDMSSGLRNRPFPDRPGFSNFPDLTNRTNFANFPNFNATSQTQPTTNSQNFTRSQTSSQTTHQSSFSSPFDDMKF